MWGGLGKAAESADFMPRAAVDWRLKTDIRATWLGHACVLVQFRDVNVLFDPVFEVRCGPSQYFGAPKRFTRGWEVDS